MHVDCSDSFAAQATTIVSRADQMNISIEEVLCRLRHFGNDPPAEQHAEIRSLVATLAAAQGDQITALLVGLADAREQGFLAASTLRLVLQGIQRNDLDSFVARGDDPVRVRAIERLYRQRAADEESGYRLLALLSAAGDARSLAMFASLVAADPPREPAAVIQAFSPLWRHTGAHVEALFPGLWEALQYPAVAVVILDLANFLYQSRRLAEHPARSRASELVGLLGHVVERLEGWEDACARAGVTDVAAAQQVADGIALAVSLAYALSLMEVRPAAGKLHRMLALRHRRLRVEAAAALARWGEASAIEQLVALAAEPVVRFRVLAYAEELGLIDRVDPIYRTDVARCEAGLVARLADPSWFGIPPTRCELLEKRKLMWPAEEGPVECYLFEYCYELPSGTLRNVGLAGPSTECLACDLTQLTRLQQYAAFAGWRIEHPEIGREEITNSTGAEAFIPFQPSLVGAGCELIEGSFFGLFFGQRVLVGPARKESALGFVVAGPDSSDWYPSGDPRRPLTPDVAFALYIGRRLLERFNPDVFRPGDARSPTPTEQDDRP
jgi:hypothetical protein